MAGGFVQYPVSAYAAAVPRFSDYGIAADGFGQTTAIVTGTISAVAQVGVMAYQTYLAQLQAKQAQHAAERQAAADRQAAAQIAADNRAAAEAAAAAAALQAGNAVVDPATGQLVAAAGASEGGNTKMLLIGGGVLVLGLGAMFMMRGRR